MQGTLFDNPAAGPPKKPRQRREPDGDAPRYVRRVKGRAYQARVWLGSHNGGSLNLGLFTVADWETWEDARWAAARASREFVKRFDGSNLRAVIEELKRKRFVPDCVLPPRVKRGPGGYVASVRKRGGGIALGPFRCPWAAWDAMRAELRARFPSRVLREERRYARDLFGATAEDRAAERGATM